MLDARQPEFEPQDLHGGKRKVTLTNCSLVFTHESLRARTRTHTQGWGEKEREKEDQGVLVWERQKVCVL